MPNEIIGEARQGQISVRSQGGQPVLEETYGFLVKAESRSTSRVEVLTTPGLPITGLTVSSYGLSVCNSKIAVRRENQPEYWDVTTTFSSKVDDHNQSLDSNPATWIPIYETKFERLQEVSTKDYNGVAIANSAGQPFENGIMRNRFIPIWQFWQFEEIIVSDEIIIARNETVNNEIFKGRAVHTLLLTVTSSVVGFYYGNKLRFTQYELRYNADNWKQKRLDVGTVYLDTGAHKPYLDAESNVILGGLNGSGAKVAAGTDPSILEFDMYQAINFSSFLRT